MDIERLLEIVFNGFRVDRYPVRFFFFYSLVAYKNIALSAQCDGDQTPKICARLSWDSISYKSMRVYSYEC